MNPSPHVFEQLARQKIAEDHRVADRERFASRARGGAVRGGSRNITVLVLLLIFGLLIV